MRELEWTTRPQETVKEEPVKLNTEGWHQYIQDMKHDVHGNQASAYKILKEIRIRMRQLV